MPKRKDNSHGHSSDRHFKNRKSRGKGYQVSRIPEKIRKPSYPSLLAQQISFESQ